MRMCHILPHSSSTILPEVLSVTPGFKIMIRLTLLDSVSVSVIGYFRHSYKIICNSSINKYLYGTIKLKIH